MPEPRERDQKWEPSAALMGALKRMSLLPGTVLDGDLAGLKPHVEEALGTLERLERQRGLSETEKMRAEALRMLRESIEQVQK